MRQRYGLLLLKCLRQTEIENFNMSVARVLDVGRLQVPVNDSLLVRRFQRLSQLLRQRQYFVNRNRSALQSFLQRFSINQLHDNATRAAGLCESEYLSDVGMVQRSENFRLPLKPVHTIGIARELIRQDFDGNFAFEFRV